MKYMTLNINCFGGSFEHREDYKEIYGSRLYNKRWDELDKSSWIDSILNLIFVEKPDCLAMQEFEIKSIEAQVFINKMKSAGYKVKYEDYTKGDIKCPSMTLVFIKENNVERVENRQERNLRSCLLKTSSYYVLSTHIPPRPFDEGFWCEIEKIVKDNIEDGIIIMGDFNTINYRNNERCEKLCELGLVDIWTSEGNPADTSTCMNGYREDRVYISENIRGKVKMIDVIKEPLDMKYSDHAAIIFEVEL